MDLSKDLQSSHSFLCLGDSVGESSQLKRKRILKPAESDSDSSSDSDDELDDEVKITVIAAGFDRVDNTSSRQREPRAVDTGRIPEQRGSRLKELFGAGEDPLRDDDDGLDVPSFLK